MDKRIGLLLVILSVSSWSYSKEFCLKQYAKSMNRWTAATSASDAKKHNFAVAEAARGSKAAQVNQKNVRRQK